MQSLEDGNPYLPIQLKSMNVQPIQLRYLLPNDIVEVKQLCEGKYCENKLVLRIHSLPSLKFNF